MATILVAPAECFSGRHTARFGEDDSPNLIDTKVNLGNLGPFFRKRRFSWSFRMFRVDKFSRIKTQLRDFRMNRRTPIAMNLLTTEKVASLRAAALIAAAVVAIAARPARLIAGSDCNQCAPGGGSLVVGAGKCDGTCCGGSPRLANPIFKSMDLVAGGIEKVLGLDRCRSCGCSDRIGASPSCDEGCDSAPWMLQADPIPVLSEPRRTQVRETVVPTPTPLEAVKQAPARPLRPAPIKPLKSPPLDSPSLPSVPPLEVAPSLPAQPQTPKLSPIDESAPPKPGPLAPSPPRPEMTQPRIVPAEPTPSLRTQPDLLPTTPLPGAENDQPGLFGDDAPSLQLPAEPHLPESDPAPKKEGSIFDALDSLDDLDDPFQEDAARLSRPYRPTRPAGSRSSSGASFKHPSRYRSGEGARPLGPSSPQVIGSGLRPARFVETLRPVSHQETVDSQPQRRRIVLPPYRASR
jgi:hypothetical protein